MATVAGAPTIYRNVAEMLEALGDVPPARVMVSPVPMGSATEADVLEMHRLHNRLFELVDGVLVEKSMGYSESFLAGIILTLLNQFVLPRNLGLVSGADGMMRLVPGLVRIPDVAFAAWDRFPDGRVPTAPIPALAPSLAVEVLSLSNTAKEMARKRREYFETGTNLVWIVDPEARTVQVYTSPDDFVTLDESATLDGGDLLPGFELPLRNLFSELDRRADG
jgi:Uma2 family endonuclease